MQAMYCKPLNTSFKLDTFLYRACILFFFFLHLVFWSHWWKRSESHLTINVLHVYIHVTFHCTTRAWKFMVSPCRQSSGWKKATMFLRLMVFWYCAAIVQQWSGTGGGWSAASCPGGADDPWVNLICFPPVDKHCRSSEEAAAAEVLFMYH